MTTRRTYTPKILVDADVSVCDSCVTREEYPKMVPVDPKAHDQAFCEQCESVVIRGRWRKQG